MQLKHVVKSCHKEWDFQQTNTCTVTTLQAMWIYLTSQHLCPGCMHTSCHIEQHWYKKHDAAKHSEMWAQQRTVPREKIFADIWSSFPTFSRKCQIHRHSRFSTQVATVTHMDIKTNDKHHWLLSQSTTAAGKKHMTVCQSCSYSRLRIG